VASFLGIERTNLYKHSKQLGKDAELVAQIKAVWVTDPAYGHRRLADKLRLNKKRVRRVMRLYHLTVPTRPKQFKKASKGLKPAPLNLLKDHKIIAADGSKILVAALVASYPHHIWAEDFTYFWFNGRFYYLATVIDLYSRVIVGWALGTRHVTELMVEALMDAVIHYQSAAVLHNDRGSEYLSRKYLLLCASLEITPSASAAGKPWENGFQESFYGKFKLELGDIKRFTNDGELLEAIALQLHYYNTQRIHTSLRTTPLSHLQNYQEPTKPKSPVNTLTTEVIDKV
jgi:transposase InsO family protein